MTGFFDRMLGKNNNPPKGSGATAKDRLQMVLTHDRIKVSPEKMKEMKAEIIAIIAKYVPEIDPDSVDIAIEQSDRYQNKLVAEIPFTKERGAAPVENDGNDDLDLNISGEGTEPNLSMEGDTELIVADEFDMDNDETIKHRPTESD